MTLDEHNAVPQQRTGEHISHATDSGARGILIRSQSLRGVARLVPLICVKG